jgi:hypothetical protein
MPSTIMPGSESSTASATSINRSTSAESYSTITFRVRCGHICCVFRERTNRGGRCGDGNNPMHNFVLPWLAEDDPAQLFKRIVGTAGELCLLVLRFGQSVGSAPMLSYTTCQSGSKGGRVTQCAMPSSHLAVRSPAAEVDTACRCEDLPTIPGSVHLLPCKFALRARAAHESVARRIPYKIIQGRGLGVPAWTCSSFGCDLANGRRQADNCLTPRLAGLGPHKVILRFIQGRLCH